MVKTLAIGVVTLLFVLTSCKRNDSAIEIIEDVINTIDTIETVYYKQDMRRTNPRNDNDTIFRYREMFFKRLISDSIVGVKGHWYMYVDDRENVIYEDIYDGDRLIRKNNRDSVARVYDLNKYPDFRNKHFWGHNTLFGMQYEFKYILENSQSYSIKRLKDTIAGDNNCYQIRVELKDKITMPGFATKLEEKIGSVSNTIYLIDKESNYITGMKGVSYSQEDPGLKSFIDQRYYDTKFNFSIDESLQFNTTIESISDFEVVEMKPE